jgi:CelD/BcsL family acetyltransferase involved in cellulose biosynthesis
MCAPAKSPYAEWDHRDSALNRLAGVYAPEDPLCSRSEWIFSFHEAFQPARQIWIRSTPRSILTLASWVHPEHGSILEPLESHWFFSNPLLGSDSIDLLRSLLADNPQGIGDSIVVLSGLVMGSPLLAAVIRAFDRSHAIQHMRSTVFRSASLANGPDGFLSRRSSKFRHNLRRAERLAREGAVTFERVQPLTQQCAGDAYARMLEVERQSWKGLDHCGMGEPPSREFYGLMFQRLATGGLARAIFAVHEGRDIGFVMGGTDGHHYRGQQFSFAADWQKESIGNLLQWEQIRWLCEEHVTRYDMGSALEYKLRWTEIALQTESIILRPRIRRPRTPVQPTVAAPDKTGEEGDSGAHLRR